MEASTFLGSWGAGGIVPASQGGRSGSVQCQGVVEPPAPARASNFGL